LTFASGAVDAISFLALGRVFTALMSGNIVLLGVAVGRAEGQEALRSAASLVAFVIGVFAASRLARRGGRRSWWPAGVSVALGCEALAQAGVLAGWLAASARPDRELEVLLVGMSALAMGLQSGAVATLRVPGVTTTYVTGTLTGLIGQLATGSGERRELVRRGVVLLALLAGAACSALLLRGARQAAPALPLAITLVVVGTALYGLRERDEG
jgi:uncharacterized membrane protein YoaK (UPF0700 family)